MVHSSDIIANPRIVSKKIRAQKMLHLMYAQRCTSELYWILIRCPPVSFRCEYYINAHSSLRNANISCNPCIFGISNSRATFWYALCYFLINFRKNYVEKYIFYSDKIIYFPNLIMKSISEKNVLQHRKRNFKKINM